MTWETVPTASIIAMAVTYLICLGVPIALFFVFKKRHAWIPAFFIGCGIFVVFALIFEQLLHTVVLGTFGTALQDNILLYALYGGLAAALFEEVGRLIAFKFFLKNHLDTPTALMYGAGHGGIEAILLVGLTYMNNIITSVMINSGTIESTMATLDDSTRQATFDQLSALWTLPALEFLLGGVERILAIALQIALSVLVYQAVKKSRRIFWIAAFLIHFFIDFITVILAKYIPTAAVELILAMMVAAVVAMTIKCTKRRNP